MAPLSALDTMTVYACEETAHNKTKIALYRCTSSTILNKIKSPFVPFIINCPRYRSPRVPRSDLMWGRSRV